MTDRQPETGVGHAPGAQGAFSDSDSDSDSDYYLFLTGAEMEPSRVRATCPGARFVARAWHAAAGNATSPPELWGILLAVPGVDADPASVAEVVTDDGRRFRARLANDGHPSGTPAEVLAAARYWELPPAYVRWWRDRAAAAGPAVDDDEA